MVSLSLVEKRAVKSEKIKADDDLILHLSRLANGSMRDALSLLDQLISTGTEPLTVELLEEFLGEPNRAKICHLLDRIAEPIRQKLGLRAEDFPLAKVLEGGTWATGRRLAGERRGDGSPPLTVISDGTVF